MCAHVSVFVCVCVCVCVCRNLLDMSPVGVRSCPRCTSLSGPKRRSPTAGGPDAGHFAVLFGVISPFPPVEKRGFYRPTSPGACRAAGGITSVGKTNRRSSGKKNESDPTAKLIHTAKYIDSGLTSSAVNHFTNYTLGRRESNSLNDFAEASRGGGTLVARAPDGCCRQTGDVCASPGSP